MRKLASQGFRTGILDLTQGELGTRGSIEERAAESREAARILGVTRRENARLPDGGLADGPDQRNVLVPLLRSFRPKVLLAPMTGDLHPDHEAAHHIVRTANHLAGLARLMPECGFEPWRAPHVYFYAVYRDPAMPAFLCDVTEQFPAKLDALRAYASQFHNPAYQGKKTSISTQEFWDSITARAAYWGSRLSGGPRAAYAECLYADGPVEIAHLPGLEKR